MGVGVVDSWARQPRIGFGSLLIRFVSTQRGLGIGSFSAFSCSSGQLDRLIVL